MFNSTYPSCKIITWKNDKSSFVCEINWQSIFCMTWIMIPPKLGMLMAQITHIATANTISIHQHFLCFYNYKLWLFPRISDNLSLPLFLSLCAFFYADICCILCFSHSQRRLQSETCTVLVVASFLPNHHRRTLSNHRGVGKRQQREQ